MSVQVAIAVLVGVAAIVDDLWRRQVSNWIPVVALVGGVAAMTAEQGWRGAGSSLLGAAAGFGVFLVFYLLGGMGGGDVKLMAGFGALLGPAKLFEAALWTALFGGLIAVAAIGIGAIWNRVRRTERRQVKAIPYAPAIAIGAWLALVPRV